MGDSTRRPTRIGDYETHPAADRFRLCNEQEFSDLVESMRAYGFDRETPAVLSRDGLLCDGRNRVRAALEVGVEPIFVTTEKTGDDLEHWILRTNVARRHLESHEKAKLAYESRELYKRRAKARQVEAGESFGKGSVPGREAIDGSKWTEEASQDFGTSAAQVERYQRVAESGEPDLVEAVDSGELSLKAASAEVARRKQDPALGGAQSLRGSAESAALSHQDGYDSDEWYTPRKYVDAVREVLGQIDLDPASNATAQEWIGAERHFTKDDDGLAQEWRGKVWLNPPYSQPLATNFGKKLIDEYLAGRVTEAVMVQNASTDTGWFHELAKRSTVCVTRGRINFDRECGGSAANRYGQVFFYFGRNRERFREVFSAFGLVGDLR